MQLDKRNMNDLEYLAEKGFESISYSDTDLNELKAKVKSKSFSFNSGYYFGFISLITGIFIGISVFFTISNSPKIYAVKPSSQKITAIDTVEAAHVFLDTLQVVSENFVKPAVPVKVEKDSVIIKSTIERVEPIAALPVPTLSLEEKPVEQKLRYAANGTVKFVHDLKVTDYYTLYFNRKKLVVFSSKPGLPATYANKEEYSAGKNLLEPMDQYYLHEAFEDGMLLFKKGSYKACINSLNNVMAFSGENDINCRFYIGMCNFYLKRYTEAQKNFNICVSHSNNTFLPEAEFYKAMCMQALGDSSASSLFKKIADEGGFYSEKASKQFTGVEDLK